jgi:UDP-N-acetylmuramoyl-L-alanyl-D-glutamate--2,6-diaminopimelate ligase
VVLGVGGSVGLRFRVQEEGGSVAAVVTPLIGDYNILNLLAVIGGLRALGIPLADAAAVCAHLSPVPGRMQRVHLHDEARGPEVVVDYAHTPDALEKTLQALRPLAKARGGKLWCVFGCGGNRDASKRPVMGEQAQLWADQVVVTSDNPRDESPQHILRQIVAGMSPAPTVIEDRAQAIAHAVAAAADEDVILLAGKGHEGYQEVAGIKRPFSDVAQARTALALKESIA